MSSPIRWRQSVGIVSALYDPENNPYGIQHAVIDTVDSNINYSKTLLTIDNVVVTGPPAFDARVGCEPPV